MANFLAVANQKGGVGKTTTAVHLSAAFAAASQRVLLVDLDAQGNATSAVGLDGTDDSEFPGAYEAVAGNTPITEQSCLPTIFPDLYVLPSSLELAGVELEVNADEDDFLRLGPNIRDIATTFDWVVFDCPPSLGILSVNALSLADYILAPLPPERFALDGFQRLDTTVKRLRNSGRAHADDPFVLITRVPPWSTKSKDRVNEFRAQYNARTLISEIPYSDAFDIAAETKRTVFLDYSTSTAATAYLYAAAEMLTIANGTYGSKVVQKYVFQMERTIKNGRMYISCDLVHLTPVNHVIFELRFPPEAH